MITVSEIFTEAPSAFETELQKKTYEALERLEIKFERVETSEVITMADCAAVNRKLQMTMVKTLFLSNRKQTEFYLFVTGGEKQFNSKDFGAALGVSRVSFAPKELMKEKLGTVVGAATVFSVLLPSAKDVRVVFDKDVAESEVYGCSDGTTTGYLKIKTWDIFQKLLKNDGHPFEIIEV